jgi:hypothetical protein
MQNLGRMQRRERKQFVGIHLNGSTHDCFRLLAIIRDEPKAKIFRDIIEQYADENNLSLENLIDRYSHHLYSQWDFRWRDKYSFDEYIKRTRESHKLPGKLIENILKKCEELHHLRELVKK